MGPGGVMRLLWGRREYQGQDLTRIPARVAV